MGLLKTILQLRLCCVICDFIQVSYAGLGEVGSRNSEIGQHLSTTSSIYKIKVKDFRELLSARLSALCQQEAQGSFASEEPGTKLGAELR